MIRENTNSGPEAPAGDNRHSDPSQNSVDSRRSLSEQGKLVYKEKKRWLFLALPFTFTTYFLFENDIQIRSGFLNSTEDDCYMYRVIDVRLNVSFLQRLFGIGTVICVTSDATNKTIVLKNIRRAKEIKDFIYKASEDAKMRRRTVNMQNIGAYDDVDGDGFPD